MRPPTNPLVLTLLRLPAAVYRLAVGWRNRYYERPGSAVRVELPVISVGNLTVGGTGKTPIVAWLARSLVERGARPAVVSRGYRGRAGAGPLVVSTGAGPLCPAVESGDEPYLLARQLEGVPIIVGSDRVASARHARRTGADVVLLDDGFQHRRLARDLDLVLLDSSNPFGNYRLLPAGRLREPVEGLRRAQVVLITRSRPGESFAMIERVVRHHNSEVPILGAGHRGLGFTDATGASVSRPGRAVAFCGIGNPARFRIDLETQGVDIVDFRAFRDHHPYSRADLQELTRLARRHDAGLVTTEKDLVRLAAYNDGNESPTLAALRIEAVLHEPSVLLAQLDRVLGGR